MATFVLAPYEARQYLTDNGTPLAGGKVNTYLTGTLTPVFTYADSIGTLNTNPVILSASGRCRIYLDPTVTYKFIITDANNVQVGLTMDPVNPQPTTLTASVFSGATGSAAAPTFTFTGDTNAGVFRPSADTVAISTSGVERMRVGSTGGVNIGGSSDPGSTNLLVVGNITVTNTPRFLAHNLANDLGVAPGVNLDFDTEIYDGLNNFSGDVFTAPVSGQYLFSAAVTSLATSASTARDVELVTSNRSYRLSRIVTAVGDVVCQSGSVIADMDAGDTASVQMNLTSGTIDIQGAPSVTPTTWFCGRLLI